jgi:hypothetical protein
VFFTGQPVGVSLQLCNDLGAKQQDYGDNLYAEKGHHSRGDGAEMTFTMDIAA